MADYRGIQIFILTLQKNKLAGFKSKAKNKNHKYQKNDKER